LEDFCKKKGVPKYVVITKALKDYLPNKFAATASEKMLE
jgi:hypothetical protein